MEKRQTINEERRDENARNERISTGAKYGSGTKDKLTYLLVGGGIGALVALLFAPKSGSELRIDLTDAARKGVDKTRETAAQLGEKSNEYINTVRQKAEDIYSRTGGALNAAKSEFGKKTNAETANEQHQNNLTAGDFGSSATTGNSFDDKNDLPIA